MLIIDMNIMYNRVFWTESSKKKIREKKYDNYEQKSSTN
jgi:hypothetical protein